MFLSSTISLFDLFHVKSMPFSAISLVLSLIHIYSINAFIGSHLLLKLLLLTVIVKCDSTKNQCNSYYHGHQSDHDFLLHNSRPFLILISILFAFISQSPCERHSPYNIFLSYNIRTFLSINSDGFQPVSDHIS